MAYLSSSDWTRCLKRREHASVKKTGVSDILKEFEKAQKKSDNSAQVVALTKLREKITEVQRKWSAVKTLTSYLDSMDKEAKAEQDRISKALDNAAEDDELDGSNSSLAAGLEKLRKVSENNAHNFALAPGKPSTGLVVTRKSIKRDHIKQAMDLRGKAGVYFTGTCFFESGKFIFVFPEQPPRGMAKAIKLAARLHAEMNIKVIVRGGGVEFNDDNDAELDEAGEAKSASGGVARYPTADKFDPLIEQVKKLPAERQPAALSGVVGRINQLIKQAEGDADLNDNQRQGVLAQLKIGKNKALSQAETSQKPQQPQPAAVYPTLQNWEQLIENCLRLDPAKRKPAIEALRKRIGEVADRVAKDPGLSDQTRPAEQQKLDAALKMMTDRANEYVEAASNAKALELIRRQRDLEQQFDAARKQNVLPPSIQQDLLKAIAAVRTALAGGNEIAASDAMDTLESKLKAALSVSYEANAHFDKQAKQGRIFDSVKQGIEVFKKGAFATGTADAIFRSTSDVSMDKGLKKLGDDFRNCEKDPSVRNLAALSKDGQSYLQDIAKQKAKLNPAKDATKLAELEAREKLARQAVQRVRLLELANEIDAVGAPPWDDAQYEKMAGLQMAFFFEEGAIKKGAADFGAPTVGDDNGNVNEAWWIKRADADASHMVPDPANPGKMMQKKGDAATGTYIFKAQDKEATLIKGIPENGGVAREVLASKLSDAMIGSGFDVGVCPTHLVRVDTSKLSGVDATEDPRTFGAIQELAANKGEMRKVIETLPVPLGDTVSHKNTSDIMVFDMAFINLDRHGGNILIEEQEDGSNKLVPIDHGVGLPDQDGLALNRYRFTGHQNSMLRSGLKVDELLDEDTRANLKNMDPRAITEELKRQQKEAEARNPELAGKVDPSLFDQMAVRLEFMKAAADILTARQMTYAIGNHWKAIADCDPAQYGALAQRLKSKLDEVVKGQREIEKIQKPADPVKMLNDLGWCVGYRPEWVREWAQENADFVARVLKARMRNPEAVAEVSDLVRELNSDEINRKINGLLVGAQLAMLRKEKANAKDNARSDIPDPNEIDKLIEQMGGEKSLVEIQQAFNGTPLADKKSWVTALRSYQEFQALGGDSEWKKMSAEFPDNGKMNNLNKAVGYLDAWKKFQSLGGMRAFIDIGGFGDFGDGKVRVEDCALIFAELKRNKDHNLIDKTLQIDPAKIDAAQQRHVQELAAAVVGHIRAMADSDEKVAFLNNAREVQGFIQAKEFTRAQSVLDAMLGVVAKHAAANPAPARAAPPAPEQAVGANQQ